MQGLHTAFNVAVSGLKELYEELQSHLFKYVVNHQIHFLDNLAYLSVTDKPNLTYEEINNLHKTQVYVIMKTIDDIFFVETFDIKSIAILNLANSFIHGLIHYVFENINERENIFRLLNDKNFYQTTFSHFLIESTKIDYKVHKAYLIADNSQANIDDTRAMQWFIVQKGYEFAYCANTQNLPKLTVMHDLKQNVDMACHVYERHLLDFLMFDMFDIVYRNPYLIEFIVKFLDDSEKFLDYIKTYNYKLIPTSNSVFCNYYAETVLAYFDHE